MIRGRGTSILLLLLWLVALAGAVLADRHVANWVRSSPPFGKHQWFIGLLKLPGNFIFALCVAALLVFFHRRSWRAAAPLLISGPFVGAAYIVIKWIVGRTRPVIIAAPFTFHPFARGIMGLMGAEKGLSFPSGHAAMAFATATCLAAALPRWTVPFFLVAAAVAAERVLENAHYLSDVVAGAGLGILCGWIALQLSARWLREPEQAGFEVVESKSHM
jgi:membrane-associated phospholipid phosphatase